MIVWVVKYKNGYWKCLWDRHYDAWLDLKSSELAVFLYPKFVTKKHYENLKEFEGF